MNRRRFLASTAAAMAAPAIVRAASATTLKFVPYADLALLDPIISAFVTRNHVMMVFDTLFALDSDGNAQPQMLAGHTVSADQLTWTLTLREGLLFHDGTQVLARDAVATVLLTVPAGSLPAGQYRVTVAGSRTARTWTLQVH